ncbi:MAG: MATE family efflux transporter [Clostridia bacterium]|nr:MATE family efflux transporter [Clostridia bacterium]
MQRQETGYVNPMGSKPIPRLLFSLAVPAVIANVVNALYNIVDQIFIGHRIGYLGNAATNIAFPLTTICLAIGLMMGLGSAAGFNLELGRQHPEKSRKYAGTAFSTLLIAGTVICVLVKIFLRPLMIAFGATDNILEYAMQYASITSIGMPFLMFSMGINPLIRGDGSALYSMMAIVTGALINVALDALFMYVFDWKIAGAAWATIIGQFISALIVARYFTKFRNVRFAASDFIPRLRYIWRICKLGFASFVFQSAMVIVQVTLNNLLRKYGALSEYGSDITIAVAGILSKVNAIFVAMVIGVVQGSQPICSYNYGARRYTRVRHTITLVLIVTTVLATMIFAAIQLFPRQIVGIFGEGSSEYFKFAQKYARGFTACMFLNGIQVSCSTFFPSIGKAGKGAIISLSKQLVLLVPLLLILSSLFGLDGVIWATPITDAGTFLLSVAFLIHELKHMPRTDDPLDVPREEEAPPAEEAAV